MTRLLQYAGQAVIYGLLALLIAVYSDSPAYEHMSPDKALIKLSFTHGAQRVSACRKLTREELMELAPNMRKPMKCPRGRLDVQVQMELDGNILYDASLPPGGLFGDGPAVAYERFITDPGRHSIVVRLRDSARETGYDYETATEVELRPGQNFVVDFHADSGKFDFE